MESYCLDTDVIVNIIRGKQPLASILAIASFGSSTTMINLLELYYGAFKSEKAGRVELVDLLSRSLTVMEITEEDVKLGGRIMAELEKVGQKLDFRDVMIGAICINRRLTVLTNNAKHFERMKSYGLSLAKSVL